MEISTITKYLTLFVHLVCPFKNKHVKAKLSIKMFLFIYNSGKMCFEFKVTDKTKNDMLY